MEIVACVCLCVKERACVCVCACLRACVRGISAGCRHRHSDVLVARQCMINCNVTVMYKTR